MSLASTFRPIWWAPTGVLQTTAGQGSAGEQPLWRTEIWPTPDDDELRVHFTGSEDPALPVLLLLHGLEGSRSSAYVLEAARVLHDRGDDSIAIVVIGESKVEEQLEKAMSRAVKLTEKQIDADAEALPTTRCRGTRR